MQWGFGSEAKNYHVNVGMFGSSSALYIDAVDLAMMAVDLDVDDCTASKPGESDKDKILAWFGIQATGGVIEVGPNGETLPEYAIVDIEQNQRAIADPDGWQNENP